MNELSTLSFSMITWLLVGLSWGIWCFCSCLLHQSHPCLCHCCGHISTIFHGCSQAINRWLEDEVSVLNPTYKVLNGWLISDLAKTLINGHRYQARSLAGGEKFAAPLISGWQVKMTEGRYWEVTHLTLTVFCTFFPPSRYSTWIPGISFLFTWWSTTLLWWPWPSPCLSSATPSTK